MCCVMRGHVVGFIGCLAFIAGGCSRGKTDLAPGRSDAAVADKDGAATDPPGSNGAAPDGASTSEVPMPPGVMTGPPDPVVTPVYSTCPGGAPMSGSVCMTDNLVCQYGDSVRADCRDTWRCTKGVWTKDADCQQPATGFCPAAQPSGSCSFVRKGAFDGSGTCVYGEVMCQCEQCPGQQCAGGPGWVCRTLMGDAACPTRIPNIGEACPTQGVTCEYGDKCHGGGIRICRNAIWQPLPGECED